SASGWQQMNFANAVAISANTVYVASYHSTIGHWSANWNFFASSGVDNPPLHALPNASGTPDGRYTYGSNSAFPTSTNNANYWVDVAFAPNSGTPPPSSTLQITTTHLADAAWSAAYPATFAASGGNTPSTCSLSRHSLPAAPPLSSSGAVSVSPAAPGRVA